MKTSECKEIFAKLSQYLDQELPDDTCREIDSHIADCPPCVEFVNSLKKSVELCRSCKAMDQPGVLPEEDRKRLFEAYQKALAARKRAEA